MSTILEYAKGNFPSTYAALELKYTITPTPIEQSLERVMAQYFNAGVDEADFTEATRAHVGDLVTLLLIPSAIDMYQVDSRLSDGAHGESISYYDRISGLIKLKGFLESRIAKNEAIFEQLATDSLLTTAQAAAGPKVSSQGSVFITTDPDVFIGINDVSG